MIRLPRTTPFWENPIIWVCDRVPAWAETTVALLMFVLLMCLPGLLGLIIVLLQNAFGYER